ncbi:MAG: DUF2975 domain-containing protein [Sphingomonadaceae bacterium]|nr:DUF2975 domain-containing protein [Sphingomonadaceae bacterium]
MSEPRRDALLGVVRLLITASMVISLAMGLATAIAFALMPVWWESARIALEQQASGSLPENLSYLIGGTLVLGVAASLLVFQFFRVSRRIVISVSDGDPFIPENATRLRNMAWLSVAVQLLTFPAAALTGWLAHVAHTAYFDSKFSLGGILLALVLFVLARVFRIGAEMREDLDGTI